MTEHPSWRSSSTAEDYAAHDFADFAQEYLRRNADYRREWEETEQAAVDAEDHADQLREGLAGRWGLCFPLRARCKAGPGPGFVAAGTKPRYRDTGKSGRTIALRSATRRRDYR
ncbi:transcriptional regulator domain-containing protein [Novosphingobium sp.]|uniref:transcriptional regulator domain-containing protein n=1 Tax=Novosphingobium sp. TaxID=1874826 RepID=UPI00286C3CB8|nr:DUF6499 domain-containing protein [Novosphingobium sp.]